MKTIKILFVLGLLALVQACSPVSQSASIIQGEWEVVETNYSETVNIESLEFNEIDDNTGKVTITYSTLLSSNTQQVTGYKVAEDGKEINFTLINSSITWEFSKVKNKRLELKTTNKNPKEVYLKLKKI
jgi:hypothetical protein